MFYGVMEFLAAVQYVALTAAGFKMHDMGGVSYFTYKMPPQQLATTLTASIPRKDAPAPTAAAAAAPAQPGSQHHQSVDQQPADQQQQYVGSQPGPAAEAAGCPEQLPLVFLHGVGAGLLPYLMFVFNLASLGRPMICVESKHVSMRLVRWLPTVDDMADATAAILKAHGSEQAVVVAHSYGTFVASRLVNKFEGSVHSLCLMDPVSDWLACYCFNCGLLIQLQAMSTEVLTVTSLRRKCVSAGLPGHMFLCHARTVSLWHSTPPQSVVTLVHADHPLCACAGSALAASCITGVLCDVHA